MVRDENGAAAVEFALVAPFFLVFAAAILSYGQYFLAVHSTAQLAAEAARASVAGLDDAERTRIAVAHVARVAGEYPLIEPTRLRVDAAAVASDVSLFKVQVSYDATALPIWGFQGLVPLPDRSIVRTAVVKRGGF